MLESLQLKKKKKEKETRQQNSKHVKQTIKLKKFACGANTLMGELAGGLLSSKVRGPCSIDELLVCCCTNVQRPDEVPVPCSPALPAMKYSMDDLGAYVVSFLALLEFEKRKKRSGN